MTRYTILLLSVLALASCAGTPFKWADARKVETGMTKQQVTGMLGAPTRVSTIADDGTRYVWVWINSLTAANRSLVIDFDKKGRVIKAPPIPDEFRD